MSEEILQELRNINVQLERIAREMKVTRELTSKFVNAMVAAESEIEERIRRFVTYMHDIHHISYIYEEKGLPVPRWVFSEIERCDDRYRQLLKELHLDGGAFEKVRREMASDPDNRWDHTRLLFKPEEKTDEAGKSK
jgi:hypothetical protein